MITKRDLILRGSYFCEKYISLFLCSGCISKYLFFSLNDLIDSADEKYRLGSFGAIGNETDNSNFQK